MSNGSYLGGLARRTGPHESRLVPPRSFVRAAQHSPIEDTTHAAPPAPSAALRVTTAASPATSVESTQALHDEPVLLVQHQAVDETRPEPSNRVGDDFVDERSPQAQPVQPRPTRPPADFVFESHVAASRAAPAPSVTRPNLAHRSLGAADSTQPPPSPAPPPAPRASSHPRPPMPPRDEQADALVSAVAAAVQWTSSNDTRVESVTSPAVEPPRPLRPSVGPAPAARLSIQESHDRPDRLADVHIGSIHVEVVPQPASAPEPPSVPSPTAASTPPGSLALRIGSYFGLHLR